MRINILILEGPHKISEEIDPRESPIVSEGTELRGPPYNKRRKGAGGPHINKRRKGAHLSARSEVRGTADTDGGAYSPFQSILLVFSHEFIIIQILRTDGQ